VIDEFHELELAVGSFGVRDVLEGPAQLLDGHILLRDGIVGRAEMQLVYVLERAT
jgi:hypothetical protein